LAVLALEFAWAEHLLERTIERLSEAGEKVRRASRLEQALLGLLGALVAVAAADGRVSLGSAPAVRLRSFPGSVQSGSWAGSGSLCSPVPSQFS
jgi:hypothetical protein